MNTNAQAITKDDIPKYTDGANGARVELPNGWYAVVRVEHDDDMGEPWKESEGHGPVRRMKMYGRGDTEAAKRPGEQVLGRGDGYLLLYDFVEAVKIARRDGWDAEPYVRCTYCGLARYEGTRHGSTHHDPKYIPGGAQPMHPWSPDREETDGQRAVKAANADFEYLHAWCNDEWQWIVVGVEVFDAEGSLVENDSLCGVESLGDYWRETAAEMINGIIEGVLIPNGAAAMATDAMDAAGEVTP